MTTLTLQSKETIFNTKCNTNINNHTSDLKYNLDGFTAEQLHKIHLLKEIKTIINQEMPEPNESDYLTSNNVKQLKDDDFDAHNVLALFTILFFAMAITSIVFAINLWNTETTIFANILSAYMFLIGIIGIAIYSFILLKVKDYPPIHNLYVINAKLELLNFIYFNKPNPPTNLKYVYKYISPQQFEQKIKQSNIFLLQDVINTQYLIDRHLDNLKYKCYEYLTTTKARSHCLNSNKSYFQYQLLDSNEIINSLSQILLFDKDNNILFKQEQHTIYDILDELNIEKLIIIKKIILIEQEFKNLSLPQNESIFYDFLQKQYQKNQISLKEYFVIKLLKENKYYVNQYINQLLSIDFKSLDYLGCLMKETIIYDTIDDIVAQNLLTLLQKIETNQKNIEKLKLAHPNILIECNEQDLQNVNNSSSNEEYYKNIINIQENIINQFKSIILN